MRYTDVAERCTLTWQLPIRQFGKKPEVAWKQGLRALWPFRCLVVKQMGFRKSFKMEQVNIEVVNLTGEEITRA